jgi:FkbM family methyltransferase
MILNLDYVFEKYKLNVSGIIHIGGHYGNEIEKYKSYNVNDIVLFEPLSSNFSILDEKVKNIGGNIIAHQVALGNDNRKVVMNISSNEAQSSSILTPKVHLTAHPEVSFNGTEEVEMKKLDDYNYKDYNMMIVDVQGYELEVLRGASQTLNNVDYIYCEVNRDEVYEGNARVEEIDDFLSTYGFKRVETQWYYTEVWGDALYMKEKKSNGSVSIICACKNRLESLKVSLSSWLLFDEIKEIIIVDWDSEVPIYDITKLDPRIKVIRVDNKKYFNLAQPLNLAVSQVTSDYILKIDTDYIINPYYNFFKSYQIDETCFVSGAHEAPILNYAPNEHGEYVIDMANNTFDDVCGYVNSFNHYFRYLRGMLYVSKENFLKVKGYNELIDSYGFEDGDMETKLKNIGLTHNFISYDHTLIHIPHSDKKRIENCRYDLNDEREIRSNLSAYYDGELLEAQTYYGVVSRLIRKNSNDSNRKGRRIEWNINKLDDQIYIAEDILVDKMKNFPLVNYVSLEESKDRQLSLEDQFYEHGITNINSIISKRFSESNDIVTGKYLYQLNDGTKGCCVSHLKAIKWWYDNTVEEYGFFCEDDLSLETVQYWNFTWEQFIEKIPEDAECVQLLTIRGNFDTFELRERYWDDWGATAYIMCREYAKKIIDTYIKDNIYHLEIPNQEVMPLIENILFSSIGKTYTIPLFVENNEFISTFENNDDDVNKGQKTNHKVASDLVLNYWKNTEQKDNKMSKSFTIKLKYVQNELEELITKYSLDTENADHNFSLGVWYENQGHTAPALSYYLRCAERSEDEDLAYEALIRGSYCYEKQGTRDGSSRSMLWQAQAFLPHRPEAYFLLSRFAERRDWWQDCYLNADLALRYCRFDCKPLRTDVEYPGKYGLLFEKAVSGYWWEKVEESKEIFLDLRQNYSLSEQYLKAVDENLAKMGVEIPVTKTENIVISENFFEEEYQNACKIESDINQNLPVLHEIAKECSHITEFGVRSGSSTRAFLNTSAKLRSYDLKIDSNVNHLFDVAKKLGKDVSYAEADVLNIEIEDTDLLFIDTWHQYEQLKHELQTHSKKVKKYIAFHDTQTYGVTGEKCSNASSGEIVTGYMENPMGLLPAIIEFTISNPDWQFKIHKTNNNGLTVLEKKNLIQFQ